MSSQQQLDEWADEGKETFPDDQTGNGRFLPPFPQLWKHFHHCVQTDNGRFLPGKKLQLQEFPKDVQTDNGRFLPLKPLHDDHHQLQCRQFGKIDFELGEPHGSPATDEPGNVVTGWEDGSAIMVLVGGLNYE